MNRNFLIATLCLIVSVPFLLLGALIRLAEGAGMDGYNWMDDFIP
jgi:hypothetical protein